MSYKTFVNGYPLNASELNTYLMSQSVATFADSSARSTAIDSPVEGQLTYLESDESYYKFDGADWVKLVGMNEQVSQAISPNYIINGAFDIWQRGTTFANPAPASFIADRWRWNRDGGNTGLNVTLSQQPLTPNDITSIGFGEGSHFLRTAVSNAGTSTFKVLSTRIEDARTLANQRVTLSFWAKAAATFNFGSIVVRQNFGSGGSANADTTISGVSSVGTTWQRYSYTLTLPSISGKTIGAGSYVEIIIFFQDAATYTFDLWGVQLEAGSVATPFKRNANSLQGELAACQRYYYRTEKASGGRFGTGYNASTSQSIFAIFTPVSMRGGVPSTSYTNLEVRYSGTSLATITAASAGQDNTGNLYHLTVDVSGTPLTAGAASSLRASANNGIIELSAEL